MASRSEKVKGADYKATGREVIIGLNLVQVGKGASGEFIQLIPHSMSTPPAAFLNPERTNQ